MGPGWIILRDLQEKEWLLHAHLTTGVAWWTENNPVWRMEPSISLGTGAAVIGQLPSKSGTEVLTTCTTWVEWRESNTGWQMVQSLDRPFTLDTVTPAQGQLPSKRRTAVLITCTTLVVVSFLSVLPYYVSSMKLEEKSLGWEWIVQISKPALI